MTLFLVYEVGIIEMSIKRSDSAWQKHSLNLFTSYHDTTAIINILFNKHKAAHKYEVKAKCLRIEIFLFTKQNLKCDNLYSAPFTLMPLNVSRCLVKASKVCIVNAE